jgi:hypothetical protein
MKGGVGVLASADQIPVSMIAAAPVSPVTHNMPRTLRSDMKSVYAFSLSGSKNPDSSNSMAFCGYRKFHPPGFFLDNGHASLPNLQIEMRGSSICRLNSPDSTTSVSLRWRGVNSPANFPILPPAPNSNDRRQGWTQFPLIYSNSKPASTNGEKRAAYSGADSR